MQIINFLSCWHLASKTHFRSSYIWISVFRVFERLPFVFGSITSVPIPWCRCCFCGVRFLRIPSIFSIAICVSISVYFVKLYMYKFGVQNGYNFVSVVAITSTFSTVILLCHMWMANLHIIYQNVIHCCKTFKSMCLSDLENRNTPIRYAGYLWKRCTRFCCNRAFSVDYIQTWHMYTVPIHPQFHIQLTMSSKWWNKILKKTPPTFVYLVK